MDDKYIKDIYDNLGGESVFGNYNDYYSLITSDDSYIKDVYDSKGESVFGSYDDFVSLVKKKDDSVVSTSQEGVTESTTKEEEQTILSDASGVTVDTPTLDYYKPNKVDLQGVNEYLVSMGLDEVITPEKADTSIGDNNQYENIRNYFSKRNEPVDLNDRGVLESINKGLISDEDLILAGYKDPEVISTIKRQPTQEEIFNAKQKIYSRKTKTSDELDFAISQFKLDKPYIYEEKSSEDLSFIEYNYNSEDLSEANVNIKDFDGFLNEKGLKQDFINKAKTFESTYGSIYDLDLAKEMELSRMLDLYISEQSKRDIKQQKLQYEKEQGIDPDLTDDKYSFKLSDKNVSIPKINEYYKKNYPKLTEKLLETDSKNRDLYKKYLEGDFGNLDFLKEFGDQGYEGFETRLQNLSASFTDLIGFSNTAQGIRFQIEQEKLVDGDNLSYSYVGGKKVNIDGKNYIVDSNNQVYDADLKIRVTNYIDEDLRNNIIDKSVQFGTEDFSISSKGMAFETSNIVGDMVVQIGLQGSFTSGGKIVSAISNTDKVRRVLGYVPSSFKQLTKGLTIDRGIASSILAQSTLGASSGYEDTLLAAKEAGLSDKESVELARDASIQMAKLYALTAPISPQTKATEAIFGKIKNETIKDAIKAYKNIGKEGFIEIFEKAGRKATTYFEEGLKEAGQENIQQSGETLVVNKRTNELAGVKLKEDEVTVDSFINTSLLSLTSGFLMPFGGDLIGGARSKSKKLLGIDGVDRIKALRLLSENQEKLEKLLKVQQNKGIYSESQVAELLGDVRVYKDNVSKIPSDLKSDTALDVISDLESIRKLENKKKTLDPSFHEDIDKEISEIRESIKQKTKEDAIQEQETRDIPDAERAEGVQEMEEEVREPAVEETEEVTEQLSPEEKAETVSELINRPVTLTKLGGFDLDTPLEGDMYVDGQRIVVEDANGNITDIGNVDKISDKTLDEMGIEQQMPSVTTTDDGNIEFEGKIYNPESARIRRDSRGNITSVTLDQVGKPRSKTLRGKNAEDAAYNVLLRQAQQSTEIEQLLEQDEEFQNELRQAEEAAQGKTDQDTEQATTEESIASPEVTIEDAPDGTFLNIEMVEGKDGREMTQKEILDALPVEPLNVEVSGKTLVIQVPRKLSGSEMMKLAKDTEQDAIPQVSGKKGVLHAQSKEKMDLYEGKFIPNLFVKPKKIIKDEKPKAGNRLFNKPLKAVKAIADKYYKRIFKGERPRFEGVKKIDKEFAKRISDAFEAMQENPNDPEVKAAYEALAKETMDQYQDFKDAGYTIEVNNSEPYKNAQEMIDDLRDNKRMKIFSTESGFGDTPITEKQRKENPLLRDSGVKDVNGETLLVNDIFRAVHDFYGHAELGNGFGPVGEENAWNVHARMFSPLARRAMTTETRGQNSYVNFSGVNDEAFKLRDQARKLRKEGKEAEAEALVAKVYEIMKFADQKIGLLPEEFSSLEQDGVSKLREMFKSTSKRKQVDNALNALSKIAPDVEVILHESEQAYAEATGETGRKQKTAGTYDETIVDGKVKKVIHINPDKANARTVAHEAFHAIFLNIVKSDAEAQRLSAAMIKAVYKSAPAELKKLIDNFAESKNADGSNNYDSAVQNEEKLAELIGYLATEYDSLPKPTKNVIKRFLDRLAKMFGMKPFTDNEVIDVLNTIAGKVARGEAVTQEDLSSIQSNAKYVSQDEAKLWGTVPERKQVRTKPDPKKTVKAYKMFRVNKSKPGKLFPLFVNANDEVLMNTWLDAEVGELTKDGKVKSKIGNLAYRPGWHMGDLPIATHIGDKYNFKKGEVDKSLKKPTARSANHVWAEVEVAADVNWQEEANKRAKKTKAGKIIPRTAHITDRLPEDGYYRYKTNPNMTGEWLIGGSIKVTKLLTDDEVKAINDEAGVADLPRVKELDLKSIGFDRDTDVDLKVTPAPTDSKGNLKTPSKKSQNNLKKRKQNIIDGVKDQVVSGEIVSTSLPNKDDVHSSKEYVVGISSLEEMASTDNRAKDQYIKISKEAASYGISKTKNVNNFEDAKQVISEFKEVVKSNLKWLYDSVDKDVRDISKLWYDGANKISNDLANQYGYTTEQVAGVMAVLSPQMDWFRNLSLGERVIDIYKNNQDSLFDEKMIEFVNTKTTGTGKNKKPLFKNKEEIISRVKNKKLSELSSKDQSYFIRVYDEVYNSRNYNNITPNGEINGLVRTKNGNPGKVGWGDFSTIEKAISILNDGSVKNISTNLGNQHKVRNFFNNISNPNDKNAVTIDTHAVAAALLKPLSGKSKQVAYNFGGSSSVSTGMTGTYPVYADAYRELANELGILPREVQSITWEAGRGLFKAAFKSNKSNEQKIDNIWNKYNSGDISLKEAQSKIEKLAGGISTPVWYEYLADNNIESLDQNSAALDQSNLDEEPITRSRKQVNLAPNGKPSNLNQEQYDIVRTPKFKNWFGDWENDPENSSKVVDENGEPLVVYHGGPIIKGDSFRKGYADGNLRGDKGIYFTENKEFAKYFAHQNELVERDKRNFEYDDIPESELETGEPFNEKYFKYSEIYPVFLNLKKPTISETGNANLIPRLYEEGADGFITKSTSDFGYDAGQYIAFEPNQIKLADGSNKTFDPDAPSIRKQAPGRPSIGEIVRKGKQNNISDADIRQFAKEEGYTDAEITAAMNIPSSEEIVERSEKAIKDKLKKRDFKGTMRYLRKKIFDRQTYIKDVLKGVGNKKSVRAHNRLVTKAGAKGFANYRFKKAEKEIFSNLSEKEKKQLDALIYARRIVAINENRKKRGEDEYVGAGGYNYDKAKSEVEAFSNDKLSKRADKYFEVFNQNLKRLRDSGRISEDVYISLRDIEYSPIKTIKYIIGDNHSTSEMNNLANSIGVSQKDIMALSDENINDLITDSRWLLMMNISAVENRAATNEVLNLFYDAIESADADGLAAISDNILDNPIIGNKESGAPKFKYDDVKVPVGYRTVSFFKDGVEHKMVMREEYARQLLDIKVDDKTLKALRKFTFGNVLRFFATSGNPLFIVGNTAVDFQNILFLGDTYSKFKLVGGVELGFDFVNNSLKKIFNTGSYQKTYEEFMTYGGGMDFLSVDGIKAIKGISRFNKPKTLLQKGMVKWGEGLSYLGETSEMAFRLAVYEKTRSKLINQYKKDNKKEPTGQDLEDILYESARESRETIDFSQGGDLVKSADYVLPYLNASVQGARRAVDYASKNPGGFASSMIQYAVMSGGLLASSLYMLSSAFDDEDDEEEKAKKMKDAWSSVSDYEKSAYHIIFTGDVDEDGEYEYYRFKKLPVIGLLSTTVEESIISTYLKSKGVDYEFNTESVSKALDKTSPIGITDIGSRNPVISGVLSYVYNKDTFTGEEIFRGPRGKIILPEAEGILDNKVEQIYKDIAPLLGMSPKRTQVMVEKVITNERTNPLVGVMYGGYNGVFSKETTVGEEMKETMNGVLKSFSGKIKRSTNSKLQEYKKMDEVKKVEAEMETEIYIKEQKVYNAIKEKRKNKQDIDAGFLRDIVKENFERKDWKKYGRKFSTYAKNANIDRSILDLIYEDTPEVQAYKIFSRYGDALDADEKEELKNAIKSARKNLNKKALSIYNKEYRKK